MDFRVSDDLIAHRESAKEWVSLHAKPAWVEEQHRSGIYQTNELHAHLAEDGILGAGWSAEYGGSDVDPDFAKAVFEEIARVGFHMDAWSTTAIVIATIERVGTETQKQLYVREALRGNLLIALGYTEPDSGSDVAAAKTAAVRDGSEWVINGQKMFTSTAQVCSHVFVLARTDPQLPKHQGLSLFMVPTTATGFGCDPIRTLGGQTTNATFYTDVRVPESALIGGEHHGWNVMGVALVYERGVGSPTAFESPLGEELAFWADNHTGDDDGSRSLDNPSVAERIGRMMIDEEVSRLLAHWADWRAEHAEFSVSEGAMRKLHSSEALIRNTSAALDILGPEGVLSAESSIAPKGGLFEREFRQSAVKTIYGGSSEIMRDVIAQKYLGLPKNRPKS